MRDATKFYTGLDGAFYTMVGCYKRWSFSLTRLRKQALIAHEYSLSSTEKTEQQLTAEILTLRKPTRGAGTGDTEYLLMGILCEICHRIMGMRPYVEQIMGALAMNQNVAIQMQTGEGKTITAALAAVMAGWRGGPCHVVTSNDYLAKRDAELMAPLFTRCGLTVGAVISGMVSPERRATYNKDVVYSTSKGLLADFLRDRMAGRSDEWGVALGHEKWTLGIISKCHNFCGSNNALTEPIAFEMGCWISTFIFGNTWYCDNIILLGKKFADFVLINTGADLIQCAAATQKLFARHCCAIFKFDFSWNS